MVSLRRLSLTEIGLLPSVHLEVNKGGKLQKRSVLHKLEWMCILGDGGGSKRNLNCD